MIGTCVGGPYDGQRLCLAGDRVEVALFDSVLSDTARAAPSPYMMTRTGWYDRVGDLLLWRGGFPWKP